MLIKGKKVLGLNYVKKRIWEEDVFFSFPLLRRPLLGLVLFQDSFHSLCTICFMQMVRGLVPRLRVCIWMNAFSSLSLLAIILALDIGPLFVFLHFLNKELDFIFELQEVFCLKGFFFNVALSGDLP